MKIKGWVEMYRPSVGNNGRNSCSEECLLPRQCLVNSISIPIEITCKRVDEDGLLMQMLVNY